MFIEKLWLRIRGELLTLKEDLAAEDELRGKAERLLEKIEERFVGSSEDRADLHPKSQDEQRQATSRTTAAESEARRSIDEIKQEWEELVKLKEDRKATPAQEESIPPNPRRLG